MYAILKTGGKQYKVKAGDVIRVEKLQKELGVEFDLTEILCVGGGASGEETFLGQPTLDKAKVTVVVTNHAKSPKVIVLKKKRRQGYRRMKGHRQLYTELFVKAITAPNGSSVKADSEPKVFDPNKKEERLKKLAEAKAAEKAAGPAEKTEIKKSAKKKVAKKATAKKKSGAKKKSSGKSSGKKKVAKKATAKKKTKRS
jgi:large subunit ribosomal protein L21